MDIFLKKIICKEILELFFRQMLDPFYTGLMKVIIIYYLTKQSFSFPQNAFSVDFSEKFYGKAYIGIGYNKQIYTCLQKERYTDPYESLGSFGIIPHTKNHTIDINIGNSIYFRINNYLRPFIGAEIVGKIPIKDHGMWAGHNIRLCERFVVHGKNGLKINVVKGWFAVLPYYIVGANVYQIKSDLEKYKDVDLSTGQYGVFGKRKSFAFV